MRARAYAQTHTHAHRAFYKHTYTFSSKIYLSFKEQIITIISKLFQQHLKYWLLRKTPFMFRSGSDLEDYKRASSVSAKEAEKKNPVSQDTAFHSNKEIRYLTVNLRRGTS